MSRKVSYPENVLNKIKKTDRVIISPDKVLKFDESKIRHKQEKSIKPWGLWYACGDEWIRWCRSEEPEWCHPHIFILHVSDKILKIKTREELVNFDHKYGSKMVDTLYPSECFNYIDWARVTKKYPGIEICPYQGSLRRSMLWYSAWDVASGCIWHSDGLISAERIL